ncbi:MAG: DUF3987 domain-containing protein [Sediminibacterium sp.]|jgi:hypothetical protein|nr:DUF3987 domain-containing protein [Sediminibacterium sp.]
MSEKTPQIDDSAFYGLAGKICNAIDPHTESDKAALLVQLLAAFGNVIGRSGYFLAEGKRHHGNLFVLIVGKSSKARKGSGFSQITNLFSGIREDWFKYRVQRGLSSGEGLISKVQDAPEADPPNDPFAASVDKRLFVFESEFGSVLKMFSRDGNTLSQILRSCWDGEDLQTMTKNHPLIAKSPHVSITGHITMDELGQLLSANEIGNGLANRFIFVFSQRSKSLPQSSSVPEEDLKLMQSELEQSIGFALTCQEISFNPTAGLNWAEIYEQLNAEGPERIIDKLSSRATPQIRRLALLLAMINRESQISESCLRAALEIWKYHLQTVSYIFGDAFTDKNANKIIAALRENPDGLSMTDLSNVLKNNSSPGGPVRSLENQGIVEKIVEKTGGRPKIMVRLKAQYLGENALNILI